FVNLKELKRRAAFLVERDDLAIEDHAVGRQQPPWDEERLRYKLAEADKRPGPRGNLRRSSAPEPAPKQEAKDKPAGIGTHSASNAQKTAQQTKSDKVPLILPCGPVPYSECAAKLFPILASRHRYFVRDRIVVEIAYKKLMKDEQIHDVFQLLEPDAFR